MGQIFVAFSEYLNFIYLVKLENDFHSNYYIHPSISFLKETKIHHRLQNQGILTEKSRTVPKEKLITHMPLCPVLLTNK